jgi:hypothetical protein
MGVTFAPNNNVQYCKEHKLVEYDPYDCEVFPFELDITNDNAKNLANILGLDLEGEYGTVGSIHPVALLRAIGAVPTSMVEFMVREPTDPMDGGAGTQPHQIQRYLQQLRTIALEAERRGEMVVWS